MNPLDKLQEVLPQLDGEEEELLEMELPPVEMTEEELFELARIAMEAMEAAKEAEQRIIDETYGTLATAIDGKLSSRLSNRAAKEAEWAESRSLYFGSLKGNYYNGVDSSGRDSVSSGGSRPDINVVRNKCSIALTSVIAYQFSAGDKNWELNPPPTYEDIDPSEMEQYTQLTGQPPEVGKMLAYRADGMSKAIEGHLSATDYAKEVRKAMWDWVVLGTGILKGPLNTGKPKKIYRKTTTSDGRTIRVPEITLEKCPVVTRVSPDHFLPDDSVVDICKAEDSIEAHPMTNMELSRLRDREDFFSGQINLCLGEEPKTYNNTHLQTTGNEVSVKSTAKPKYLVLEYYGPVTKDKLDSLQIDYDRDSPYESLYAEVWTCNGRVIKFELLNLEGYHQTPYCVSVWEPDPASMFGFGIPMLVRDQQRVVSETYKMLLDNAGISAGPQIVIDTTIVKPLDGVMECTPFKIWALMEYGADASKAMQFFTPPNSYEGLASLLQLAKGLGDEESSIPMLLGGASMPTGVDSATGTAIMNQNATAPLFFKAEQWDDDITAPLICMTYDWEMQFNPDDSIKGTYNIDVRTSTSFLRNQQDQSKLERLSMELAQGSPANEFINMDVFTQARLAGMRLPFKGIMKSPEEVQAAREQAEPPPPDPQLILAQNDQARVEIEKQRLQIESQKVAVEAQNTMQQAQLKFQTDMRTNDVRLKEAEATVLKTQGDFNIAMANLAQKDEQGRAALVSKLQIDGMKINNDRFLAGLASLGVSRQQDQKDQEIQIKREELRARERPNMARN